MQDFATIDWANQRLTGTVKWDQLGLVSSPHFKQNPFITYRSTSTSTKDLNKATEELFADLQTQMPDILDELKPRKTRTQLLRERLKYYNDRGLPLPPELQEQLSNTNMLPRSYTIARQIRSSLKFYNDRNRPIPD